MESIIMIVLMFAVLYFLLIRPENKRKKQAQNMRDSLKNHHDRRYYGQGRLCQQRQLCH